jgi:putative phage-type endonuclease
MNQATATAAAMHPKTTEAGRALWLSQRRKGIGGTDASAILGVNPWASEFDVWLEKTGRAKEKEQTKAMEWGLLLENVIGERYMARTGRKLWNPDQLMAHPEHPVMIGTPDRLVIGEERGVDIKTANAYMAHEWGAEFTDEIPRQYVVQCAHYMAITGFPAWDVAVLIGGNDDRIYTVRRDLDFERLLVGRLTSWWERYVVKGEQPPIDGGNGSTEYLKGRFPTDKAPRAGADEKVDQIGQSLAHVKRSIAGLEENEAELTNQIKEAVGDASGMDGTDWRVTWTGGREKETVNHEKYAQLLADYLTGVKQGEVVNQALAASREKKTSPRAFRFSSTKFK